MLPYNLRKRKYQKAADQRIMMHRDMSLSSKTKDNNIMFSENLSYQNDLSFQIMSVFSLDSSLHFLMSLNIIIPSDFLSN